MRKENKYGCIPNEDVCLKHDKPLIFKNFCEDSPDIKDYIKIVHKNDENELIKIINENTIDSMGYFDVLIQDYYKNLKK